MMFPERPAGRGDPRPTRRLIAAGMLVLALAACQKPAASQSDAPVPVLSGSASDAMLPLDTVTSQPPLDPRGQRSARAADDPAAAETEDAPDVAPPVPAGPAE